MAVFYLDVDDEITSAAARIRTAEEVDVALVLPAGSRIATSRINFRLLAHEATRRSRRLSIVAPEASARALAVSAGLPVFASVVEYEQARGQGDADEGETDVSKPDVAGEPGAGGRAAAATLGAAAAGAAVAGAAAAGAAAGRAAAAGAPGAPSRPRRPPHAAPIGAADAPPGEVPDSGTPSAGAPVGPSADRPRPPGASRASLAVGPSTGLAPAPSGPRAGRRRWPLVLAAVLGVGLLGSAGAAVGYVLLPTATVTLQLVTEPVGPVTFTGTADPEAVAADPTDATIPATRVPVALSATGTFPATGKRVEASPATGKVRWTNCDPTRSYTIPKGTLARTPTGIAFITQEAIFLPVAVLDPPRITCQNRTVDVTAQRDGPAGNVAAGSITVVPGEFNDVVIKVNNPAATTGGAREVFPQVSAEDVSAAVAALTAQLDAQLAEVAADPPGVPPGATAYPETARRGEAVPSEVPEDLVDREVETFELTLTADGTVVAADPTPLEAIAAARVVAAVPDGMTLLDGSTRVEVGEGIVTGETISYPVSGEAEAIRGIDEAEVRDLVVGKSAAEAEKALAPYGRAQVVLWPDWASTVTGVDARLTITVEGVAPADGVPVPEPGGPTPTGPAPAGSPGPPAPSAEPDTSPAGTAAP